MNRGNIQQAEEIISSIPTNFSLNSVENLEYQKFLCFFNCVKRSVQDSALLCFDSIQINTLDSLVTTDTAAYFIPTIYARNALQIAGLLTYNEFLYFDEKQPESLPIKQESSGNSKDLNCLEIYPNPACDYFIADYKIDLHSLALYLNIIGFDGKIYGSVKLDKYEDQKVMSTKTLLDGSYLVELKLGKKRIEVDKLIIIR